MATASAKAQHFPSQVSNPVGIATFGYRTRSATVEQTRALITSAECQVLHQTIIRQAEQLK